MPMYGYNCTSCNGIFDKVLKISERNIPTEEACPSCGIIDSVERTVSSGLGFHLHDHQPLSGDFKNLLENIKRKNTTLTHKSTIRI